MKHHSCQKRKNMRLNTIKYLLLFVWMMTALLPVYGSTGGNNTKPKRLSPALNYIYVEYTSIDKWSYSEDINGIGYGATSYGCKTTWAESQNDLLRNKQLPKELTLEEFYSIYLDQDGYAGPLYQDPNLDINLRSTLTENPSEAQQYSVKYDNGQPSFTLVTSTDKKFGYITFVPYEGLGPQPFSIIWEINKDEAIEKFSVNKDFSIACLLKSNNSAYPDIYIIFKSDPNNITFNKQQITTTYAYNRYTISGYKKYYKDSPEGISPKGYEVYTIEHIDSLIYKFHPYIDPDTFVEHYGEQPIRDAQYDFQQYEESPSGNIVVREFTDYVGIIIKEPEMNDDPHTRASALKWTLTDTDVQKIYDKWDKQTEKTFDLMTAVKYEDNPNIYPYYGDFYVLFKTNITFKPCKTFSLTITATGSGSVGYSANVEGSSSPYHRNIVSSQTKTCYIENENAVTLVFLPDNGYMLEKVVVNNKEVTASISNNKYTIDNITENTTVEATFEQIPATGIEVNATNFPDEAFRNWVLQNVSGASDGILTDDEIAKVTSINCSNKNISNLQGIEFFTALTTLNCSGNKLSSLDVSKNTALKKLSCQNNKLVSLDVSGCTAITEIECFSNQLTTLDVSKNTALTSLNCNSNQLASLDVSRNAALVNLYCGSNQLTSLDISNNTALKELNCQINSITNLSGLSTDLALTLLICDRNQLKTLDVSRNTALTRLYCHTNQFTSLNVSRNTALTLLYCYNNQLTTLDLSKNTVLESLYCDDNQLSKLDVTNNTALKELSIDNNRLTSLDVTKNTSLTLLSCVNNLLTNLDVSRNTALSSFWCNNNQLTVLDVSRNTKLTRLDCYGNQLLCLNLGTNTSINDASTSISPQSAALSAQNISEGIAIPVPSDFDYSKVSNLKLAGTSVTGSVATVNGQMYLVFAKTGTAESAINGKMLTYTYNTGNSFNKASSVDVTVTLSYTATTPTGIEVNATNFPDEAFRNWILQNVSGASDGILTEEEIARVLSIKCRGDYFNRGNITSLQGIEFFTALTFLDCQYNQLTALDISKNLALTSLWCRSNQLTSLDVSKNTALLMLSCGENNLTSLDVSKNTALTYLDFYSCQLTSIDVSNNTALETFGCGSNQLKTIDVSKNTSLTGLDCYRNQLTSLDVSKNTALTSLRCYSNQLLNLDLSNNTSLTNDNGYYNEISPQSKSLIAVSVSSGIAIPVPIDFDLKKVMNLKFAGTSVNGSVTTVDGQKYLVFAQTETPQSAIDGKNLTYTYNTGNSLSEAASMEVTVILSYTATTYSLFIQSGSGGSVSYNGTTITNTPQSFTIAEGSFVTITMTPNSGYKLALLTVNGTDVTPGVKDNKYTINSVSSNTTVVVTFKALPQNITVDGINYEVKSATDYTLNVGKGDYSGHVVIPATVSYDGDTWTVAGVVDGAFNLSAITAITWNPNTAIGDEAFGAQTNPNLLLYVKSEAYAPSNVQNVIANGRARKIVLTDAASGNDFFCPEAFTAEEISYTHRYGMTTGIGECRGWETIALPFTVQKVMHQTKGQLVTFKQWDQSTSAKPYWLYKLAYTGFVEADFIEANTPYVISMPNHEKYFVDYILEGNVTFSAQNATVKTSENMTMPTCNEKTFRPCFAKTTESGVYAINAVNSWVTNTGGYKEGSVFIDGLRSVLPFEAYMTTSTANAKGIIPIFETQPTAIREIPMQGLRGEIGVKVYNLNGQLVLWSESMTREKALKRLPAGIYIMNGKKITIK